MSDILETIGRSLIQHGPNSSRVYLMKLDPADTPVIHDEMEKRVREHGYGKIFAKIPETALNEFRERGYREEARIPGYYRGHTDGVFMCRYYDENRATDEKENQAAAVLQTALQQEPAPPPEIAPGIARILRQTDIPALARLYRKTFATYPFPITEAAYLERTMQEHVVYFGVFEKDRLIAASSAETDSDALAVEMTDFATEPDSRGRGLARGLLALMDARMQQRGMRTAYTIARALSHGINITFKKGGYTYGGTLKNNTGISRSIESMNVWYHAL